jgi:hypothetical protein
LHNGAAAWLWQAIVESREDADIELELCIGEEAGRRDLVWNIGYNEGIARDDENRLSRCVSSSKQP